MSKIDRPLLRQAVERLHYWQYGGGTSFTCYLFRLFQKADQDNVRRMAACWPAEHAAWELWRTASNEDEFFIEWGLPLGPRNEGV